MVIAITGNSSAYVDNKLDNILQNNIYDLPGSQIASFKRGIEIFLLGF
jgi:hypothetical protein